MSTCYFCVAWNPTEADRVISPYPGTACRWNSKTQQMELMEFSFDVNLLHCPSGVFFQFTHCTWPSEQQLLRCAQLPEQRCGSKEWQHNSAKTKPCGNQPGYSPLMPCANPGQLEIDKCRRFCDPLIKWPLSTPEAYCTHQAQIWMCNHSHSHEQNRACCCSSTSIVASTMSRISSNESCDWEKKPSDSPESEQSGRGLELENHTCRAQSNVSSKSETDLSEFNFCRLISTMIYAWMSNLCLKTLTKHGFFVDSRFFTSAEVPVIVRAWVSWQMYTTYSPNKLHQASLNHLTLSKRWRLWGSTTSITKGLGAWRPAAVAWRVELTRIYKNDSFRNQVLRCVEYL